MGEQSQKHTFLQTEGDQWYFRNAGALETAAADAGDDVVAMLSRYQIQPVNVLEVGCSNGYRLSILQKQSGANCFGIDPSSSAIENGKKAFPGLHLSVGTADQLSFEDRFFDVVIFGFCLYLCDRDDLFKIAYEADRVLGNGGVVVIKDFCPPFPYKNVYHHKDSIQSYKMDYSKLFLWNPSYSLMATQVTDSSCGDAHKMSCPDDRVSISLLYKQFKEAYPVSPFTEK